MKNKLKLVLLVDDLDADNYYHKVVLRNLDCAEQVAVAMNGQKALEFLTTKVGNEFPKPDLIMLDINMPVMDGWEFLAAYEKLPADLRDGIVMMMVSTSLNEDDHENARQSDSIRDFIPKPLSEEKLLEVLKDSFPGRFDE